MKPSQPLKMSGTDVEAILAALPIAENFPVKSPEQRHRNLICCLSARKKLLAGEKDFTQNELRVIAISVCYVSEYLSGRMPELEDLHPNVSAIRRYSLSYIRLSAYFLPQLTALDG